MQKVAIFGAAGAVGRAVGAELARRGIPFRAVGRSRAKLAAAFPQAEIVAADLADPQAAIEAARGVDTIIYTVGVPYNHFELHPQLMKTTVAAAGTARLAVVSSVYSYGVPETRTVAETHPRRPTTFKGRMRKEQEDIALAARGLVVRLPDFCGPWAENSFGNMVIRAALEGKTANWLGSPDKPHEFVYVPDSGPVIVELASRPDCYGDAWNFAGPGEIRGAEFMTLAYRAVGREPKWRTVGSTMLKLLGLFNPLMKEMVEMHYLFETPVILDDSKLRSKLGEVKKTPYEEGIKQTLQWMRA